MQAIVVQTFIAAPAAAVWRALYERTDILFDGLPAKAWPEGGESQEPYHFTKPWPFTEAAGAPTEVSVTLHDLGEGVRVDVRHAGWGEGPAWDEMIQGHFAGWLQGLAALGLLIESGVDARQAAGNGQQPAGGGSTRRSSEKYLVSGEIASHPSAVYRCLTDPAVMAKWANGAFAGREVTESIEDRFIRWNGSGDAELTAILRITPRGTHLAIAEYGVTDRAASQRWPATFEALARFLS